MKTRIVLILLLLFLTPILSGCSNIGANASETFKIVKDNDYLLSKFGISVALQDSENKSEHLKWQKEQIGYFVWGDIEKSNGSFDWSKADKWILDRQNNNINTIITIWPYADFDAKKCRDANQFTDDLVSLGQYRSKPCDIDDYKSFVTSLVERYDADGADDFDQIKFPVRFFEIMQNPANIVASYDSAGKTFFNGSAKDYFEIQKASYEAIKQADESAYVLPGVLVCEGVDGDFWKQFIELGGNSYLDFWNFGAVYSGDNSCFDTVKNFLAINGVYKGFLISQFNIVVSDENISQMQDEVVAKVSEELIKGYLKALSSGSEKIFFDNVFLKSKAEGSESEFVYNRMDLDYNVIFEKIGSNIEILDGAKEILAVSTSQYRIKSKNGKIIYALWGENTTVAEDIKNAKNVKVSETNGVFSTISGGDFRSTNSLLFIEAL